MRAIRCATSGSSQVREVLGGIGAGEIRELSGVQQDRFDGLRRECRGVARRGSAGTASRPRRGSRRSTGAGLPELREAIAQAVRPHQVRRTLHLDMPAAAVRSDLYRRNAVRAERQCDDGSWELDVELD